MTDDLHTFTVSDRTRAAYKKSAKKFFRWIKQTQPAALDSTEDYVQLDRLLAQYINHLFRTNPARGNYQDGVNCKAALLLWNPQIQPRFPLSTASLKGWDRRTPRQQRKPAPAHLVFVAIQEFLRRDLPQQALMTWLMFDGYFRISEVAGRHLADCNFRDATMSTMSIYIGKAKTGLHQSVLVTNPHLLKLFRHVTQHHSQKQKLFTISQARYRSDFKDMMESLGVGELQLSPHSLRHGGATEDLVAQTRTLQEIIKRERWKQDLSSRQYLQAAQAIMLNLKLPEPIQRRGARLFACQELIVQDI
jgi:integrase